MKPLKSVSGVLSTKRSDSNNQIPQASLPIRAGALFSCHIRPAGRAVSQPGCRRAKQKAAPGWGCLETTNQTNRYAYRYGTGKARERHHPRDKQAASRAGCGILGSRCSHRLGRGHGSAPAGSAQRRVALRWHSAHPVADPAGSWAGRVFPKPVGEDNLKHPPAPRP